MKALPQIAIVGRPNVGKSAIFNRLAGRRIAIVHDQPGVTRDRIAAQVTIGDGDREIAAELTDTGGIGTALDDGFAEQVRVEADIAIAAADLILFVVDAREGLTPTDESLAAILRQANCDVILVANKVDTEKTDPAAAEFTKLGFDDVLRVSAAHGRHFGYLEDVIAEKLAYFDAPEIVDADAPEVPVEPIKIAIVGRPNVGKSSLINAIMRDERSIVSDVAGTTRDSVDVPYEREGESFLLIDTAGIRKRGNRDTSVEVFSVMRSERTIRRADICLLVIDASSGVVGQDRRIAKLVIEAQKPCIVLLNKFDLYHPEGHFQDRIDQFREELGDDLFFLPYAPKVAISAKNRQYLSKIFGAIDEVKKAAETPIPTGLLNRLLARSIELNPPPVRRMKRLKLLYATQKRHDKPGRIPVPEYMMFVNYANLLTRTYERFLENKIRAQYPMDGLPFIFNVKQRQTRDREDGKGSAGARVGAKKSGAKTNRSTKGKGRGVRK